MPDESYRKYSGLDSNQPALRFEVLLQRSREISAENLRVKQDCASRS